MKFIGPQGVTANVLALHEELRAGLKPLASLKCATLTFEVGLGSSDVWIVAKRGNVAGLAIRAAHLLGGANSVRLSEKSDHHCKLELESAAGRHSLEIETVNNDLPLICTTHRIMPKIPLLISHLPRDLYPLGTDNDPYKSRGKVEASQRGHNDGLCYFIYDKPKFGSVLYCQDLTHLNPYFSATDTTPDTATGGEWPELGFFLPAPTQKGKPPINPLPARTSTTLSNAVIVFHENGDPDEAVSARRFLQMKAAAYNKLFRPPVVFRDWRAKAQQTLSALDTSPDATIKHYGHRYIHPYTASEYPDVMVQVSVLSSLVEFDHWQGKKDSRFREQIAAGIYKFYDSKIGSLRRYLPNVGSDKDKNAVDSWYLYHPLINLGRMANNGDLTAKRYFIKSLDYAIKAARHFKYRWPIQYDMRGFAIITEARNEDGLGQTDVGGVYAYAMLMAFQLLDDQKYLDEARAAIDAAKGMRFELAYQTNLTAWGAAACLRLWNITDEEYYLDQSYVYLASFFHNCILWKPEINLARHYNLFFQPTCLHDAPYAAMYECFDAFVAIESFLKDSGPDLDESARMLLGEYCKYAVSNAWYYYPDSLPSEALAKDDIRNGHIDPKLPFPLEDLYPDGQPAGQVGQEIYGSGAAFFFASRMFHEVSDGPFMLYCDHFLTASEPTSAQSLIVHLAGGERFEALLAVIPTKGKRLPKVVVKVDDVEVQPRAKEQDRWEYIVPARGSVQLTW